VPIDVVQTTIYARWFASLRDQRARDRVLVRIRRLSLGNFGDARSVGGGVSELRIDYGPGYRIYFTRRGATLVLLLTAGDKSRQWADIARARELAAQWEGE
jgi:putative addiction module killer protein